MKFKPKDIIAVPSDWAILFRDDSQYTIHDINAVLAEPDRVFNRGWYNSHSWGKYSFNANSTYARLSLVKITVEKQAELAELLSERIGICKITDMKLFAISLKLDWTQKATNIYADYNRDATYIESVYGYRVPVLLKVKDRSAILNEYDVILTAIGIARDKFKADKHLYAVEEGEVKLTEKALKRIKGIQKKYPRSHEKVYWVAQAHGLLKDQILWNMKKLKQLNAIKGVEW